MIVATSRRSAARAWSWNDWVRRTHSRKLLVSIVHPERPFVLCRCLCRRATHPLELETEQGPRTMVNGTHHLLELESFILRRVSDKVEWFESRFTASPPELTQTPPMNTFEWVGVLID